MYRALSKEPETRYAELPRDGADLKEVRVQIDPAATAQQPAALVRPLVPFVFEHADQAFDPDFFGFKKAD
jgi:hypothetical protein